MTFGNIKQIIKHWNNPEYRNKIRRRFYTALVMAILVIGMHQVATSSYLYWELDWFDIPMHMAGGFMVALFGMTFFEVFNQEGKTRDDEARDDEAVDDYPCEPKTERVKGLAKELRKEIIFALIFTFVVGVAWEVLEWSYGLSGLAEPHRWDTISDVVNDLIGSGLAMIFWNKVFKFNGFRKK